ncbi:MAG: ABC transporter ATP-binding protein [Sedimentisphaerales bacterium]|nr:ABC transporter ATP-binding protein [Sedimentisphaerales bacterium]
MSAAIDIKQYSYHYANGVEALCDIDLTIKHGQKVALIGPNGAGKSTLLLAMNMFIEGSGQIFVDGLELNRCNIHSIRKVMGFVVQDPEEQLFMPTVFDDVAFGPLNLELDQEEIIRRVKDTLKRVGLEGMEDRAPYHLSAGQKRAAAIATVLSMKPKIIIMDEPDTSLDPRSRNRLIELLSGLSQTLIIATCNMDFAARLCDHVILVDQGRVVVQGAAEKILSDGELMDKHGLEVPFRSRYSAGNRPIRPSLP